MILDKLNL